MALTDPAPLPAGLAFPAGEEPISDAELEAFVGSVLALAEDAGLDPEGALAQLMEPADYEDQPQAAAQRWRIEDDGAAEWALRHLRRIQIEREEVEEQAQAWAAEIERWRAERLKPLAARRAFFEGAALDYLRRLRAADPKVKSRKLPSGTLKSTGSGPKVGIADEAAVIAWAKAHLEGEELKAVVKTTEKAMVSELRKLASVGQRLDGIRFEGMLSCGHELVLSLPVDADGKPIIGADLTLPKLGEGWACLECPPEFGENVISKVIEIGEEEILEAIPADNDTGAAVPGAIVEPASVTLRVELA